MGRLIDLTGQRFGRLTVIQRSKNDASNKPQWHCLCDCGKTAIVRGADLKMGKVYSCGCYRNNRLATRNYIHGKADSQLHIVWKGMKQRCTNPKHNGFTRYGGRGIKVCDEWLHNFQAFYDWATANGYRDGLSIDRIDNNKGYSPDNCRWVTREEQNNNTSSNHLITLNGQTKTLAQWGRQLGIKPSTYGSRMRRGWPPEEALGLVPRKKS
ncbi:MAG: hypothetical protein E7453_06045 [Ruminococcaceae bacterium]|nr:hypothetical protein [Oscillospiraceae bacterium]